MSDVVPGIQIGVDLAAKMEDLVKLLTSGVMFAYQTPKTEDQRLEHKDYEASLYDLGNGHLALDIHCSMQWNETVMLSRPALENTARRHFIINKVDGKWYMEYAQQSLSYTDGEISNRALTLSELDMYVDEITKVIRSRQSA